MKALALNIKREQWESTAGMNIVAVEKPVLDESTNSEDGGKVIIKPVFSGFCGSDRSIWFRHAFKEMIFDSLEDSGQLQRICGHELLGEVVEAGSYASKLYGFKPGDFVSTESHIFCGRCHQCMIGDAHVCSNHLIIGITADGCFAEYVKLPAKELWRTDTDLIRPEVAAIQEPFGNAVHACGKVDLRGKTAAIFGCGTIGLFSILAARCMGAACIIGVDANPINLKLAEDLGVDMALLADSKPHGDNLYAADKDLVEQIKKRCFGEGVDVALEMAGSNRALNNAIASTRAGGDIILFGLSTGDYTLSNFQEIIMHGKSLHSVVGRKVFQTWFTVSNLLQSKAHGLQDKIFDVILNKGKGTIFPFHDFDAEQFEKAISQRPKVILKF